MAWMARGVVRLKPFCALHLMNFTWKPMNVLRVFSPIQKTDFFTTPCRVCQGNSLSSSSAAPVSDVEFMNIYTFRYIVHTRVLSRFKIYQTLVTLAAIPPAFLMHENGVLSSAGMLSFFGIASTATVMLYVMSTFFRHIVGIISINQSEDIVRISHLTFWGRRRDVEFDVADIVPLSDMSVKPNDIYQVIQFYDKQLKFYWFLRHGKNINIQAVQRVFGKI